MSQETSVITFRPLKNRCDDESTENRTTNSRGNRDDENAPFTISSTSRRHSLDFDIPSIRINASESDHGGGGEIHRIGSNWNHPELTVTDGEYLPEVLKDKFDYTNLACKPLEEVDPNFKYEETFLVISRDGRVHRLSAKKSSFIFNPFNRLRKIGIRIAWSWELSVLIRIALICLCFSFVLPNYANNAVSTVVWNFTRYIFGGLLFAEICANILARGFLVSEFTYLQSPWDWLDVTTFIIIFLNLYWKSLFLHSLEGVVLFKFIPIVAGLKTGFQLSIQILKNLVPALIYSLLTLWILVMVGLHIKNYNAMSPQSGNNTKSSIINCKIDNQYQYQMGPLLNESSRNYELLPQTMKPQTILPSLNQSQENNSGSNIMLNTSLNSECFGNYSPSPSPIINLTFQTTGLITFQAFGTISTTQIPDPLLNHFLYITLTLIFGTFGVSILTAASVGLAIFTFRPNFHHDHGQPSWSHNFPCLPKLKFQLPGCDIGALVGVQRFLRHPFLELFITAVLCADIVLIMLSHAFVKEAYPELDWILQNGQDVGGVCMLIYGIEFLLKFCFIPSSYLKSWWPLLDFAVAVSCALNKVYPVTLLTHFRVLKVTSRWPTLQLFFYVLFKTFSLRLPLICVLFLGWFTVRFATVNYIYGSNGNIPSNLLALSISQSFLITDWMTGLNICQSGGEIIYLCYVTWLLEVIFGVVFSSVIFVTVINSTCDLVSRPVNCCCENDNYINLKKSISLIKCQFQNIMCCICSRGEDNSPSDSFPSSSLNPQVRVKEVPVHLHIPTLNGGPNNAHHSRHDLDLQRLHPPPFQRDAEQGHEGQVDNQQRKYSLVPSMVLGRIRTLNFLSCLSVGIIFTATAACILEFDLLQRTSPYYNPRFFIDLLFVCYFLLILLWKLVKNNFKSLKSPPWLLDFLIISASGFTIYTSILSKVTIRDLPAVKFITSLSYFRGIMLVTRLEWLKVGLIGITSEVRVLWRYLAGLLVVWMCLLWLKNNQEAFSSKWFNDDNDDDTGSENITLVTALGKISIKSGLLLLHILLSGVFVGVIISELLRSEQLLSSFMTPAQIATYKDNRLSFQREKTTHVPSPQRGLCIQITHYLTLTHFFDITVMATIICDCFVITFHHLTTSKDWRIIWGYYPAFIICVYACELSMKFIGWRSYYWKSAWNIFDSFVVLIGIIDILFFKIQLGFVTADTIRFLRLLRIFQLELFTKNSKLLHLCHSSLLKVLPCVANICCLYGLLIYTFTTVGLHLGINNDTNADGTTSIRNTEKFQGIIGNFNNILVSLISLPVCGSVPSFKIAQTNNCWTSEYVGTFLLVYVYSCIVLSYILNFSVFAIVFHEILQILSISGAYSYNSYSKHKGMTSPSHNEPNVDDDVNENKYKHTNGGGFLNCDFAKSPDDLDSTATMLTPIEPMDEDPLGEPEDERYPLRMSANGYILHVEATVTAV